MRWRRGWLAGLVLIQATCARRAAEQPDEGVEPSPALEAEAVVIDVPVPPAVDTSPPQPSTPAPDRMLVSDQVYLGWKYYQVYCARCHGDDARGTADSPDLTCSLSEEGGVLPDSFTTMVTKGATSGEMKGFEDLLDPPLVEGIYAYLKARSDGMLPAGRPHRAPTAP